MERRQLEYLVAVADAGSVTRAAELLHVAQPGVSAQVAQVERELGERVFDRDRRGVRLTSVGAEVVTRARRALAAFDDVRAAVDEARGMLAGVVTVGTVRGAPLGELATALGRFRLAHPGVDLRLVEAESAALFAGIGAGDLDLALVGLAGPAPDGVHARITLEDRLAVAVGRDHPWHARRRVGLADLATQTLVAFPPGTGNRDALDAALRRVGVTLHVAFEAGTVATVLELARAGLGAAVVPAMAISTAMGEGLRPVTLTPAITSRLALAWADPRRRTPSPAVRALLAAAIPAHTPNRR